MPEDSFKAFVLDQLSALRGLRARAMFGAHGLYQGDHFFGILDEGRLFFKVSEATRPAYEACGMGPFTYQAQGKTQTMGYYEVPPDVLETPPELTEWARLALQVAATTPRKPAKKRRPSPR